MSSLSEIDAAFSEPPGFRIVDRLAIAESGVDPIGLRQLNLDLMDETVPGINNVTMLVRPYCFMAWAWWKARQVAAVDGEVDPKEMAELVARYEAIYAWAHCLAENPFRGAAAVRAYLPLKGSSESFSFKGEKWEQYKKRMTSIMAPTEYGPSLKSLHFLQSEGQGTFRCSQEAEAAVVQIDKAVSSCIPTHILARKPPSVTCEQVEPIAIKLPIQEASKKERDVFRFLFYQAGASDRAHRDMRRRKATIDLIHDVMPPSGREVSVSEIRRRLAAGGSSRKDQEVQISSILLAILQARQLQRLAVESMMLWVEQSLSHNVAEGKRTEQLAIEANSEASKYDDMIASSKSVAEYVDAVLAAGNGIGWPKAAASAKTDIVELMGRLQEAQRRDIPKIPGLALRAFAVVYAVTQAMRESVDKLPETPNPVEARPDRLPMGLMVRRIDAIRNKPLVSLWCDVIENWIVAQHVHWSAIRSIDGKKRLRIALETSGWIRVRSSPSRAFVPTPDRLLTLLSLGSECGLFKRQDGDQPLFGRTVG
ncbi:hypothetical protein [Bradyrhizobium japonicum]|uniref:hypothetical protein n=1 Tax=Bradyrhizobium japonicum TaxID=375 RepID=UPI001BAC2C79|nr:hypothetical protein [Bradyrhizobium japonicum]MBR0958373.1 hypothetical protein [Bradyrhizobium japonicum]